jgi:hypothetical protein
MLVSIGKVQMCLVMLGRVKRAFLLYHSLHARLFQVLADCVWGERLIDDIGQSFGDLDCIFCLMRSDEMDSIANISGRKFRWATSNRLLELRMLFEAKSGYYRRVDTSSSRNGASRLTIIKHSENDNL